MGVNVLKLALGLSLYSDLFPSFVCGAHFLFFPILIPLCFKYNCHQMYMLQTFFSLYHLHLFIKYFCNVKLLSEIHILNESNNWCCMNPLLKWSQRFYLVFLSFSFPFYNRHISWICFCVRDICFLYGCSNIPFCA